MIKTKESENTIEGLKFFHWRNICEEIESHWSILWDRDSSGNWQTSVAAALSTYAGRRFKSGKEIKASLTGFWTLIDDVSPADLEPLYSRPDEYYFDREGKLVILERARTKHNDTEEGIAAAHEREAKKLRRQMRKLAASYVFSNLDFDRPNPPGSIVISRLATHTAPQIKVEGEWTVSNALGYCMARTTHGIDVPGQWYFEMVIDEAPVRVGVAQILAQTQGPVGFDEYSYGIRSRDGAILHCGKSKAYGEAFGDGTVIGVAIVVPPMDEGSANNVHLEDEWPPLKFGQYQVKQEPSKTGTVSFTINGKEHGIAFRNIYLGKYYPAVSMFGGASITLNLGPSFKFTLPNHMAVSELANYNSKQ